MAGCRSFARQVCFAAAAALLLTAVPVAAAPATSTFEGPVGDGRRIARVELRTDLWRDAVGPTRDLLRDRVGDTFDLDVARQMLLDVQGTGLVAETEIYSRLEAEGVVVTVVAWAHVIVDSVELRGELGLPERELRDLSEVRERTPLLASQVLRSVYRMKERFEREGYLDASVRAAVDLDEPRKRASVAFVIEPGQRATVEEIRFDGDLGPLDRAELLGELESESGGRYWASRARRDVDNLRRALIERGYRTARVGRPVEAYAAERAAVTLAYPVELGPRVEVEILGAERRALRREGLLPFLGEQGYDSALVVFAVRRLTSWYQGQGYYHVAVDTAEEVDEDLIRLVIRIEPGERFTLKKVVFEGNETFAAETLQRLMATSEKRLFSPGTGRLVDERLDEDLVNLRSYYALQGFGSAVVGPAEVEERPGELRLTVPIEEGRRRTVERLEWSGTQQVEVGELARGLAIQPAGPYHRSLLTQALNEIRARYRDRGFDHALVSSTVEWNAAGDAATVGFQILEGSRTVVRRLVIRGQQLTSPWLLRRAIGLEPGEPVSRSRLLEIQRQLYELGIFRRVDVSLAQGEILGGERDVVVQLEEGDRHRLSLGGGFDSEAGLRALAGYSIGNLGGRGISLHLDTVYAQREELFRLLLVQPRLIGFGIPFQYSLFRTLEEESNLSRSFSGDFVTEQVGAQVEAGFRLGAFAAPVIYTYKLVDNNAPAELDEILFDREKSKVRISSLSFALQLDRRDSPINATRGRNTLFQVEYAFPFLDAEENFLKVFVQQTQYLDLGSGGVVGASLRLGGIEPRRSLEPAPESSGGCAPDPIPDFGVALSERFFAGGRSTHRAYDLDTLGIPGETLFANRREEAESGECLEPGFFPTGGNGTALFNLDYRYEVVPGIWAVGFFDSGNVWADWRDVSLSEVKHGAGIGALWESPVGPLRLEIGWKLDREPFEDPYQIYLSFGTAF